MKVKPILKSGTMEKKGILRKRERNRKRKEKREEGKKKKNLERKEKKMMTDYLDPQCIYLIQIPPM